jgi:5-methyltetrahydropteroyltriglutamate--homocysteine methyltransferase
VTASQRRIATTHTGSLPRPLAVQEPLAASDEATVQAATVEIVERQRAIGLDIVNDGELSKPSYATYVSERLSGFGGESSSWALSPVVADFPEWGRRNNRHPTHALSRPACDSDVSYHDMAALASDIERLRTATAGLPKGSAFMSAASPGVITMFLANQHYSSHEEYLYAVADAMKTEYDAIHAAGFILQLDCPDLAAGRLAQFPDLAFDEWKKVATVHIDALNHATRDIPPQAMRMHVCWGNSEGPHHLDVPLRDIVDLLWRARPAGLSLEGANPRHEHEWQLFEDVKLPEGKILIPGVIDSTTNYIEHPELVAQRLRRYADVVGIDNVIGATDCGFATLASFTPVSPDVAWAKLGSLVEGASLV